MPHVGLPLCGGARPGKLSKLSHESQFNLVDLQCGVWAEGAFKFKGLVPPEEGIVHVEESSCPGMWYAGERQGQGHPLPNFLWGWKWSPRLP